MTTQTDIFTVTFFDSLGFLYSRKCSKMSLSAYESIEQSPLIQFPQSIESLLLKLTSFYCLCAYGFCVLLQSFRKQLISTKALGVHKSLCSHGGGLELWH